jgi:hypothetical protein
MSNYAMAGIAFGLWIVWAVWLIRAFIKKMKAERYYD